MTKKITLGDYVTTCYSSPIAIQMKFEIEEIRNISNTPHAFGVYGEFPMAILKKTKRPEIVKKIKSKRKFIVNEEINHPFFGKGIITEVLDYTVKATFKNSGKTLNFISQLFEKKLKNQ